MSAASPLLDVTRRYLAEENTWEPDGRTEPLWEYVRYVLTVAYRSGKKAPPLTALQWAEQALRELGERWISFNGVDDDADGRSSFLMAYERAQLPAGVTYWQFAWEMAQKDPIAFPTKFPCRHFVEFLNLAYRLQEIVGPGTPIVLPVKEVAEVMGRTRKTISNYRQIAVMMEGFLIKVAESSAHRLAAKFLFNPSWVKKMSEVENRLGFDSMSQIIKESRG